MTTVKQEIQNILDRNFIRGDNAKALKELLNLYDDFKRQLLKSILEDMDSKYSEYHRDVVEGYLNQ